MTTTGGVNPIHSLSDPASHWSTTNTGEAMPGVLTPLGWSVWGPSGERATRQAFYLVGALVKAETEEPVPPEERFLNIFYGRAAARVDFLARIGDVMPGTSGAAVATKLLGYVPPDLVSRPTRSRWPAVAARFPVTFPRMPRATIAARKDTEPWWRQELARTPHLSLAEARQQFAAARGRFERNLTLQTITVVAGIRPKYDQLSRLATRAGMDGTALMSGQGAHDETATVEDLWLVSPGRTRSRRLPRAARLPRAVRGRDFRDASGGRTPTRCVNSSTDTGAWPTRRPQGGPKCCGPSSGDAPKQTRSPRSPAPGRHRPAWCCGWPPNGCRCAGRRQDRLPAGPRRAAGLRPPHRRPPRRRGCAGRPRGFVAQLTVPEIVAAAGHPAADVIVERKERHREYQDLRVPDVLQGLPEPISRGRRPALRAGQRPHHRNRGITRHGRGPGRGGHRPVDHRLRTG